MTPTAIVQLPSATASQQKFIMDIYKSNRKTVESLEVSCEGADSRSGKQKHTSPSSVAGTPSAAVPITLPSFPFIYCQVRRPLLSPRSGEADGRRAST